MQSFSTFVKDWWQTAIGFSVLIAVSWFAISHVFFPKTNNVLGSNDIKSVSSQDETQTSHEQLTQTAIPTRLIMPSINLALDVIDSTIDPTINDWPLSDSDAHFANFTPKVGEPKGTMLIYGHNTVRVMQKTSDLRLGDGLTIVDQYGESWHFTMTNEAIIKPEDVGFIYEDVPFRIVIFTCNGWNDEYRRLMFFSPKKPS